MHFGDQPGGLQSSVEPLRCAGGEAEPLNLPSMMNRPSNAPAPDELLLTAREALKTVLKDPGADHAYTILMAMNAMGIAARAMRTDAPPPARPDMNDEQFRSWVRRADAASIVDAELIAGLRRHVEGKLAVSNPRFEPEPSKDKS